MITNKRYELSIENMLQQLFEVRQNIKDQYSMKIELDNYKVQLQDSQKQFIEFLKLTELEHQRQQRKIQSLQKKLNIQEEIEQDQAAKEKEYLEQVKKMDGDQIGSIDDIRKKEQYKINIFQGHVLEQFVQVQPGVMQETILSRPSDMELSKQQIIDTKEVPDLLREYDCKFDAIEIISYFVEEMKQNKLCVDYPIQKNYTFSSFQYFFIDYIIKKRLIKGEQMYQSYFTLLNKFKLVLDHEYNLNPTKSSLQMLKYLWDFQPDTRLKKTEHEDLIYDHKIYYDSTVKILLQIMNLNTMLKLNQDEKMKLSQTQISVEKSIKIFFGLFGEQLGLQLLPKFFKKLIQQNIYSNQNNKYLKNEEKFFFMISAQMKSKFEFTDMGVFQYIRNILLKTIQKYDSEQIVSEKMFDFDKFTMIENVSVMVSKNKNSNVDINYLLETDDTLNNTFDFKEKFDDNLELNQLLLFFKKISIYYDFSEFLDTCDETKNEKNLNDKIAAIFGGPSKKLKSSNIIEKLEPFLKDHIIAQLNFVDLVCLLTQITQDMYMQYGNQVKQMYQQLERQIGLTDQKGIQRDEIQNIISKIDYAEALKPHQFDHLLQEMNIIKLVQNQKANLSAFNLPELSQVLNIQNCFQIFNQSFVKKIKKMNKLISY